MNLPTAPTPLAPIDQLRSKIASLDQTLVKIHPQHKSLLHEIHRAIHADESLIYLVSPEEISKITASLQELAGQKILEDKVKTASKKSNKALSNLSLDDI
jgi:hypothetical protein